jgi:hypothetical protein
MTRLSLVFSMSFIVVFLSTAGTNTLHPERLLYSNEGVLDKK